MQHQGRTSFENEGTAGPDKGFQQREGADGLLYEGSICDIGNESACLLNPFQASALRVNHGSEGLYGQGDAVSFPRSNGAAHSGAAGYGICQNRRMPPGKFGRFRCHGENQIQD